MQANSPTTVIDNGHSDSIAENDIVPMTQVLRRHKGTALALALGLLVNVQAKSAEVLSVGDGDTITVTKRGDRIKVRLACIDSPETSQRPYGVRSRNALKAMLPIGTSVTLKTKAKDRYGRTVAEIYEGGRNLNQALVGQGQAFVYWQYIQGCDRGAYWRLEQDAKLKRLGVWSVPGGIQKPWDYRKSRNSGGSPPSRSSGSSQRKWRCAQVGSWQQAQDLLQEGHTYLDRDKDGEACESLR